MLAIFAVVLAVHWAWAQPDIVWDGRIPTGTQPSAFDAGLTPYVQMGARPEHQTWDEIITTYGIPSSLFDGTDYQGFKMTFTDETVFTPNPGFIRAHLKAQTYYASNVATFHFSVQKVVDQPLNKSHQYELVFLESDQSFRHIFELRYGTDYTYNVPNYIDEVAANRLRLQSSSVFDMKDMYTLFEVDFKPYVFHNFAVTVDWYRATIAVWYSEGDDELQEVVHTRTNPVDIPATFQVGLLKVPVGPSSNPSMEGFQEKGINEAIVYGGIFVENSEDLTVTTKPYY